MSYQNEEVNSLHAISLGSLDKNKPARLLLDENWAEVFLKYSLFTHNDRVNQIMQPQIYVIAFTSPFYLEQ